jgi:hypothetical protein
MNVEKLKRRIEQLEEQQPKSSPESPQYEQLGPETVIVLELAKAAGFTRDELCKSLGDAIAYARGQEDMAAKDALIAEMIRARFIEYVQIGPLTSEALRAARAAGCPEESIARAFSAALARALALGADEGATWEEQDRYQAERLREKLHLETSS